MNRRQTVIALAACATLFAIALPSVAHAEVSADQGPPFRTTSDASATNLMLMGYDPVAYFKVNDAVVGDPANQSDFMGVTWRFSSAENQAEFLRSPETYMPQFGGFCSNGINYAVPWGAGGGPNTWRIYRGKLYVFGGQSSRDQFEMETELNLQRAHQYWTSEIADSNPLVVRYKRLIFRVPHYKSDAALQAEWEAKRAAGSLPVMPGQPQVVPAAP
ncbi:YHS domain-containing (seleno)protein [Hydrogenophaga crassostreae]|nr:YHS domain-containing (seleno)protein [Hydrogenophaga crassostreae]